jgi:hypothetical protein
VSIDSNSHLSHNFLLGPLLIINTTRSAQLAGWPGTIISDTFSIRQYCGTVDFTKSLAVNGATIVGGANVAEAVNGPVVGGGVGVNPTVLNGVSPEIASLPNLVSSVVSNIYNSSILIHSTPTRDLPTVRLQTTDQMLMIADVQARTGLHTKWAADLVVTSGFDLALAGTRFEEMRVSCRDRKRLCVLSPC